MRRRANTTPIALISAPDDRYTERLKNFRFFYIYDQATNAIAFVVWPEMGIFTFYWIDMTGVLRHVPKLAYLDGIDEVESTVNWWDDVDAEIKNYEEIRGLTYIMHNQALHPTYIANNMAQHVWMSDYYYRFVVNSAFYSFEECAKVMMNRGPETVKVVPMPKVVNATKGSSPAGGVDTSYSESKFKWGIEGMSLGTIDSVGVYVPWWSQIDYRSTKQLWGKGGPARNMVVVYKTESESQGYAQIEGFLEKIPWVGAVAEGIQKIARFVLPLVPAFARRDILTGYVEKQHLEKARSLLARELTGYSWYVHDIANYMIQKQKEVWFQGSVQSS